MYLSNQKMNYRAASWRWNMGLKVLLVPSTFLVWPIGAC